MNSSNTNIPDWKQRLAAELKRDKKKTAILAVLVTVAAVVAIRLAIAQSGPAQAGANVIAARSEPEANSPAAVSPSSFDAGELLPAKSVPRRYIPKTGLKINRDIFNPSLDFFPPKDSMAKTSAKLMPSTAPIVSDEQLRREVVQAQARTLVLQSTINSSTPTAIINGRVLCKGDWINGFQVLEITTRTCILEKKNIKVVLEMGT